ncbi:MAG TPA: hypothetical protein VJ725_21515 [Thermoanaerobaculia bacterium]|nr:hypothetical protein [Thermoanaerobaculia bacterium]
MREDLRKYLVEKLGSWNDPEELFDNLRDLKPVWEGDRDQHRWRIEKSVVVQVGDRFVGFKSAETTGDNSIWDGGFTFSENDVWECEPKQSTVTIYVEKKGEMANA